MPKQVDNRNGKLLLPLLPPHVCYFANLGVEVKVKVKVAHTRLPSVGFRS